MAEPCQQWQAVPLHAFSNPDVVYLGEPIGSVTQDNAAVIEGNMVSQRFIGDTDVVTCVL